MGKRFNFCRQRTVVHRGFSTSTLKPYDICFDIIDSNDPRRSAGLLHDNLRSHHQRTRRKFFGALILQKCQLMSRRNMPIGHKTSKSSLATRIPHRPPVGPTLRSANRIQKGLPFLGPFDDRRPSSDFSEYYRWSAVELSVGTRFERVEL